MNIPISEIDSKAKSPLGASAGQKPKSPKGSFPEQVHLSLTKDASEMVVMWVTRTRAETSVCRYWAQKKDFDDKEEDSNDEEINGDPESDGGSPTGTNPGPLGASTEMFAEQVRIGSSKEVVVGTWRAWCHTVKITKLKPGTIYVYVVGDSVNRKWSEEFSFKTRPYGHFAFTMVTFADFEPMQEINKQKTVIARLNENLSEFDLILEFGDICYANGDQQIWDNFFNHIQPIASCKPWMVTVGNHENEGDFGFAAFENRFKMPGKNNFWYSFDYSFAHFVVVSTEHDFAEGSEQHNWLCKDLERANKRRDEVPWIIMTGHRALYGSNKRWFHKDKAQKLRNAFCPVIDKFHVDLCLFGHCHAYERTHPIRKGDVNPQGTIYVLAGVAGAALDKEWHPQPQWSAYRTAHHGYGLLHVKSPKKLRFCYHRERDGKMWDAFTLQKRKNGLVAVSYDYKNKFLSNWLTIPENLNGDGDEEEKDKKDKKKDKDENPFFPDESSDDMEHKGKKNRYRLKLRSDESEESEIVDEESVVFLSEVRTTENFEATIDDRFAANTSPSPRASIDEHQRPIPPRTSSLHALPPAPPPPQQSSSNRGSLDLQRPQSPGPSVLSGHSSGRPSMDPQRPHSPVSFLNPSSSPNFNPHHAKYDHSHNTHFNHHSNHSHHSYQSSTHTSHTHSFHTHANTPVYAPVNVLFNNAEPATGTADAIPAPPNVATSDNVGRKTSKLVMKPSVEQAKLQIEALNNSGSFQPAEVSNNSTSTTEGNGQSL